jgi:hypothetical protein
MAEGSRGESIEMASGPRVRFAEPAGSSPDPCANAGGIRAGGIGDPAPGR